MKKRIENATIIGTGNVATHLAIALYRAGISIDFIIGRSEDAASEIAQQVNAQYSTDFASEIRADLLILAVSDDVYSKIITQLNLADETIVVHTSGSLSINIFSLLGNPHGVFYPLQTFTKGMNIDFSNIPICIEASNADVFDQLKSIANLLSSNVMLVNSAQRLQLHVAAVFCCNFVNYLFTCTDEILSKNKLPFSMMKPLIEETAKKALEHTPLKAQTGPAKRGDLMIVEKHINMLDSEQLQEIYSTISKQIFKKYNK